MARFVQPLPPPEDPYAGDRFLRLWLDRLLGADGHAAGQGPADRARRRRRRPAARRRTPTPRRTRRGWSATTAGAARVDRVETSRRLADAAGRRRPARRRRAALPDEARGTLGRRRPRVQHALLHLYGPESATFSCPVAMADGAAALLSRPDVDPAVRDAVAAPADLHRPGHGDHQRAVDDRVAGRLRPRPVRDDRAAGQRRHRGGSPARSGSARRPTRRWRSRWPGPDGAGAGQPRAGPVPGAPLRRRRGVGCRRPQPGVTVHRLKDKLGTRALPTAEIGLRDAYALPLGDPAEPGLAATMTLVVVTRLHNAAAAAAGMRRGLAYAARTPRPAQVAGGRLVDNAAAPGHPRHPGGRRGRRVRAGRARVRAARPGRGRRRSGRRGRAAAGRAAGEAGHRPARGRVGQRVRGVFRRRRLRRGHRAAAAAARRPGAADLGGHHQRARPRRAAGGRPRRRRHPRGGPGRAAADLRPSALAGGRRHAGRCGPRPRCPVRRGDAPTPTSAPVLAGARGLRCAPPTRWPPPCWSSRPPTVTSWPRSRRGCGRGAGYAARTSPSTPRTTPTSSAETAHAPTAWAGPRTGPVPTSRGRSDPSSASHPAPAEVGSRPA